MSGFGRKHRGFPISAGTLFGLGLGGFFDGIVLHQVLQWHHMLTSAGYPADSVPNLEIDTFWNGLFHANTCVFVLLGLIILRRTAHRTDVRWSGKLLAGPMLLGFGIFNLVEGVVDHHIRWCNRRYPSGRQLRIASPTSRVTRQCSPTPISVQRSGCSTMPRRCARPWGWYAGGARESG